MICEAHEGMVDNIKQLRGDVGELYNLHREMTARISSVDINLAQLFETHATQERELKEFKSETRAHLESQDLKLDKILAHTAQKKMSPGMRASVAIITSLFGSGAIAAIIAALVR